MKTFKYRLRPSKSQRTRLLQTLEVFSQILQNVQERVDLAFQAFFRRVKAGEKPGYPRFRGNDRYHSFTFKQFWFSLRENRLFLSKIGTVKMILHRPMEGKIKTLTIRRDAFGNWYACFTCEVEPEPLPFNDLAVGIDLGLKCFATFSSGEGIENPRFFRREEKELARAQRKLSKAERGTPERAKRRRAVWLCWLNPDTHLRNSRAVGRRWRSRWIFGFMHVRSVVL